MIWTAITGLVSSVIDGFKERSKQKHELKKAVTDNRIRLAQNKQSHNQDWEMKQLDNAGWKDDILFYACIAMFVWSGFDPEGAGEFFKNLNILPDWFIKTWFWLIASILGVKKIGDYLPGMIGNVKTIFKKK